jgi:CDP-diacylglycerol--glycerol-3-phosphate 3-phosphatidyltransferase
MFNFRNFNIADWFSFYRIVAVPPLLVFLFLQYRSVFAVLLLISYSTDAIDGFLARRLKITSPRGSQLDSIGDQLTFVMGLAALLVFEHGFIMANLGWILIALLPYLVQMVLAWKKYGKSTAFHTYLAKISAIMQSVFILHALFFGPSPVLFFSMLILGLIETIEEIILIQMHSEWRSDIKGIYWVLRARRKKAHEITNE